MQVEFCTFPSISNPCVLKQIILTIFILLFLSCQQKKKPEINLTKKEFVISFGSCNNQNLPNTLWKEILKSNPDIFIWGGDIIYSDTYDMRFMKKNYEQQKKDSSYQDFIKKVSVIGTWDDHDYGENDGGSSYSKKDSAQSLFLDFFDIDSLDQRRSQKGIYFSKDINLEKKAIKILVLDTRYFRSDLTIDSTKVKIYIPNKYGIGTILGETQWKWLENELQTSKADFNIILSSIQFLSKEHGFETWGNMPHEVDKMTKIISISKAKGVIFLSGDRHIGEISKDTVSNSEYPIIDITSSGITHSYTDFQGEPNDYRIGNVVADKNFGILHFNLENNTVLMEIRGEKNILYESYFQKY